MIAIWFLGITVAYYYVSSLFSIAFFVSVPISLSRLTRFPSLSIKSLPPVTCRVLMPPLRRMQALRDERRRRQDDWLRRRQRKRQRQIARKMTTTRETKKAHLSVEESLRWVGFYWKSKLRYLLIALCYQMDGKRNTVIYCTPQILPRFNMRAE